MVSSVTKLWSYITGQPISETLQVAYWFNCHKLQSSDMSFIGAELKSPPAHPHL